MPTETSLVTGVDFVAIPTRDIHAAIDFYGNVLGLEAGPLWQRGDAPPMGAEFETGTVTLSVIDPHALGQEFAPHTQAIALHVEDVHAAKAELESRGVRFMPDVLDSGVCHMAFFSDPDGNPLMLHHRYKPRD